MANAAGNEKRVGRFSCYLYTEQQFLWRGAYEPLRPFFSRHHRRRRAPQPAARAGSTRRRCASTPARRIADNGALVAYSGKKTGRSPLGQAHRPPVAFGPGSLVGRRQCPAGATDLRDQPRARRRLPQHAAVALLRRRLRRLGPALSAKGAASSAPGPITPCSCTSCSSGRRRAELAAFGKPDFVIYNAGQFPANSRTAGMTSKTSIDLSLEDGEVVILGTEYAGEMKKGVFTVMNYLMPQRGVLSMHCAATADRNRRANRRCCSASRARARRRFRPTRSGCSSATTNIAGRTRDIQHRRRLLCQGDPSHAGIGAGHLPGAAFRRRPGKRGPRRRGPPGRLTTTRASPKTPAAPTRSNTSPTAVCRAWAATRRT